jgi:hypothetical protein
MLSTPPFSERDIRSAYAAHQEMPSVGNLESVRSSTARSISKGRATISTDEFHGRVSLKPCRKRLGGGVSQQINRYVVFQVHQKCPITLTFAPSPFVHTYYFD